MSSFEQGSSANELNRLRSSYLYKLSSQQQLNSFQNLVFVVSSQDEIVSYESARVEKNRRVLKDTLSNRPQ